MKVIVTAGASYEPIDEVRRLTNFSTGELGTLLSRQLAVSGFEVFCLRSVAATFPLTSDAFHHLPFTTNDDLLNRMEHLSKNHAFDAVLHAAALCDFKVKHVQDSQGAKVQSAKLESRTPFLTVVLEPATKVLAQIRNLFPNATIVGWKYELAGTREDALAKAWRQIDENRTDACILNGRAYGAGFALCTPPDRIRELKDKPEVAQFLPGWLKECRR